jgi:hypothetical protein
MVDVAGVVSARPLCLAFLVECSQELSHQDAGYLGAEVMFVVKSSNISIGG